MLPSQTIHQHSLHIQLAVAKKGRCTLNPLQIQSLSFPPWTVVDTTAMAVSVQDQDQTAGQGRRTLVRLWERPEVTMTDRLYPLCRLPPTGVVTGPPEVAFPRVVATVVAAYPPFHIEDEEDILLEDVAAMRLGPMDRSCPELLLQLASIESPHQAMGHRVLQAWAGHMHRLLALMAHIRVQVSLDSSHKRQ